MVWGELEKDGMDATDVMTAMINGSKFAEQLHLVLLDGITFGAANVVDIAALSERTGLPMIAVMRRQPDLAKFRNILDRLPESEERHRRVRAAGEIHQAPDLCFQVAGEEPESIPAALKLLTDRGKIPEALRIAHLIGSAVMTGQSGKRA
jgi:endonuclease V-like protein UPF0215 family